MFSIFVKRFTFILSSVIVLAASIHSQADIIEDFNDAVLTDGFYVTAWNGFATSNPDNETWRLTTDEAQWRYAAIISPPFTGDTFTATLVCRNFTDSYDAWERVAVYLKGSNYEILYSFGLEDTATFNLDSAYSAQDENPQSTDPILLDTMDLYPESLELEIEYNGSGQPINFYYAFDGGERIHATSLTITASSGDRGPCDLTVQFYCGENGPFGADLDMITIVGAEPEVPTGAVIHDLSREVSTKQGQDHWYYRMGDPAGGAAQRDLTWSGTAYGNWEKSYWFDEVADPDQLNWADIIDVDTTGGPQLSLHNDTSSRIEWESPYPDGTHARLTGTFKFDSDWDGAIGVVLLNGAVVWESGFLELDGAIEGFDIDLPGLNQGDIITLTADGAQWHWVQFVHTRIYMFLSEPVLVDDWPVY